MKTFSWIQLDLLDIVPDECIGDYEYRLILQALLPIAAAVGVWCIIVIFQIVRVSRKQSPLRMPLSLNLAQKIFREATFLALPWLSLIIFVALPRVSTIIFNSFSCTTYGPDAYGQNWYYLNADTSWVCKVDDDITSKHESLQSAVIGLIFTWPVTVLLTLLVLLLSQRRTLMSRRSTPLSNALNFLHCEYHPHVCFFEVVDMFRRIALMGGVLLIPTTKSMLRLIAALLITIGYLPFLIGCSPYRRGDNFTFAVAAQVLLLCVLVLAMVRSSQRLSL